MRLEHRSALQPEFCAVQSKSLLLTNIAATTAFRIASSVALSVIRRGAFAIAVVHDALFNRRKPPEYFPSRADGPRISGLVASCAQCSALMVQIIPICSGLYVFLVRRQHDAMK